MSTVLEPPPIASTPPTPASQRVTGINLSDEAFIPAGITDLASFRRWADSELYPSRGKYAFFQGQLWVDLTKEQLFTHNQVKFALNLDLGNLIRTVGLGYLFVDGIRLSNAAADLSAEPDAVFVSFAAIQQGKVKLVRGQMGGYVELEGSPELVVEIVSPSSVRKDTEVLREMYAQAGVLEYWLIDARTTNPKLELLALTPNGYQPAPTADRGQFSAVLSQNLCLDQDTDPLGNPRYVFRIVSATTGLLPPKTEI